MAMLSSSSNGHPAIGDGLTSPMPPKEDKSKMNYDQLLPGDGDLWGSILDSVSNNREKGNVPTRRLIILGDRNTGKSTLVSYLSSTAPPSDHTPGKVSGLSPAPVQTEDDDVDIGTSYTTVDIGDDGDDDPLARLSIHQIPSALPPYSNLLPLVLNPESLRESLILVLIPLTHPNSLLTSLVRWLALIQSVIKSIKETIKPVGPGQSIVERGEYITEEAKEALEAQYRSYVEPAGQQQNLNTTSTSELVDGTSNVHLDLPLPPGTLTENMGIGIVIVCTKSDQIDQLEKEKDFKEEQFDFIQQVLRSVCLRFGGGLFFTSDRKPESMMRLRTYVLHRLFGQIGSTAPITTTTSTLTVTNNAAITTTSGGTTSTRLFSFPHKANVVDRDEVLIPMGWDSWGKIKILRDGFDPLIVGNGWLLDLERYSKRVSGDATVANSNASDSDEVGWDSDGRKIVSACKLWEDMIGEAEDDIPSIHTHDRVIATQEQQFLKTKYETIKKERELDPRSHFQTSNKTHSTQNLAKFSNGTLMADAQKGGLLSPSGGSLLSPDDELTHPRLSMKDLTMNGRLNSASTLSPNEYHQSSPQSPRPTPISHHSKLNSTTSQRTNANNITTTSISSSSSILPNSNNEKEVLAEFFGKLLVKEPMIGNNGIRKTSQGSSNRNKDGL